MSTAWMFPGHGCQYVGMGASLLAAAPGQRWIQLAERTSGLPLQALVARGPLRELTRPQVVEPVLAAIGGAYVDWLASMGLRPTAVAGYSAGEVMAMYAAGVIDAETSVQIACLRGAALERAAQAQAQVRPGSGMVSLSGQAAETLVQLVEQAALNEQVFVAAHNGPRHLAASGSAAGLILLGRLAKGAGVQVRSIDAAGPWHTPLVTQVCDELMPSLADLPMRIPLLPLWLGSHGAPCAEPALLRQALARSIVVTVQWQQVIEGLRASGVQNFLECGPGRTLWALLGQMAMPAHIRYEYVERPGSKRLQPLKLMTTALPQ